MRLVAIALLAALLLTARTVVAQPCYEAAIMSPSPFMGNNEEIFKLSDGSLWEVKYEYEYLYEYYPEVIMCPSKGKLVINGKQLNVERVSGSAGPQSPSRARRQPAERQAVPRQAPPPTAVPTPDRSVIESQIAGEFNGWEGETIFKLVNGQIWQQSTYAYTYSYHYMPKVMIVPMRSGFEMHVEGVDGKIGVTRLK